MKLRKRSVANSPKIYLQFIFVSLRLGATNRLRQGEFSGLVSLLFLERSSMLWNTHYKTECAILTSFEKQFLFSDQVNKNSRLCMINKFYESNLSTAYLALLMNIFFRMMHFLKIGSSSVGFWRVENVFGLFLYSMVWSLNNIVLQLTYQKLSLETYILMSCSKLFLLFQKKDKSHNNGIFCTSDSAVMLYWNIS